MPCPICLHQEAKSITQTSFDGISIGCPVCGDFDVAGPAEDKFWNACPADRQRALEMAKQHAGAGQRPMISLMSGLPRIVPPLLPVAGERKR